jgi:hypothetical protein
MQEEAVKLDVRWLQRDGMVMGVLGGSSANLIALVPSTSPDIADRHVGANTNDSIVHPGGQDGTTAA